MWQQSHWLLLLRLPVLGAGQLLARLGNPSQRQRWLPALASGERQGALALQEQGGGQQVALQHSESTTTSYAPCWCLVPWLQ